MIFLMEAVLQMGQFNIKEFVSLLNAGISAGLQADMVSESSFQ